MKGHLKLLAVVLSLPFFFLVVSKPEITTAQTKISDVETAGHRFKNIKVLNDMPADQLGKVMNIFSASLGENCDFCHVPDKFELDDKKEKAASILVRSLRASAGSTSNRVQTIKRRIDQKRSLTIAGRFGSAGQLSDSRTAHQV